VIIAEITIQNMKQKLIFIIFPILVLINSCYQKKSEATLENIDTSEVAVLDSNSKVAIQDLSSLEFKIQTNLKKLSSWIYSEEPEFDIDSLNILVDHQMIEYLVEKQFPVDSNSVNLTRITSPDGFVNIYNYAYSSGGTAGDIITGVVQWKKSNGKFGAKTLNLPADFTSSYILSKTKDHTLYLFIGGWKGSSRLECACAEVFELVRDSLNLNYPAFYNQHSALLYFDDIYSPDNSCIACIDYSTKRKEIVIKDLGSDDQVGPQEENSISVHDYLKGRNKIYYIFNGKAFIEK